MKNALVLIIPISILLSSCGDPAKKEISKSEPVVVTQLELDEILDVTKVSNYLKAKTEVSKEANELFLKGVDASINKNLPDSAKFYFEHAIQLNPSPNTYYELGNVYKALNDFDKSLVAYQLAERLDYSPYSNILYQTASIYSLKKDEDNAAKYLELAFQAGFVNLDKMNQDPSLKYLREDVEYLFLEAVKRGTRGTSNLETMMWMQFKRKFNIPAYPVKINGELTMDELETLGNISFEFDQFIPEMRNSRFSRDVGQTMHYGYVVGENSTVTALLYLEHSYYNGDWFPNIFTLITFNKDGKKIDKLRLEGVELKANELVNIELAKPFQLTAQILEMGYEKPMEEDGLWDNRVVSRTPISSYNIVVSEAGKISKSRIAEKQLAKN